VLCAVVDEVVEGHRAGAQRLVEGVGVEAKPDAGAAGARDLACAERYPGRADPAASIAAVLRAPDMKRRRAAGCALKPPGVTAAIIPRGSEVRSHSDGRPKRLS